MERDLIVATDVRKTYPAGQKRVEAVRGIDLTIARGDFVVIFGPSGCGKSTLLNILTGIEVPTVGSVRLDGTELFSLSEEDRGIIRSQKIGIVHQMSYWIRSLNVVENVAMPLMIAGYKSRDAVKRAGAVMEVLKILPLSEQSPTQLSGGEQQKVGIARALVSRPEIIVADEPTGNLDSSASDEIVGLLSMLNSQLGRTVLLVTHNPAYWEMGTTRVEMKDGQKVKEVNHGTVL